MLQPTTHHIELLLPDGNWYSCDDAGFDITLEHGRDWLSFTNGEGVEFAIPLEHLRGMRARRRAEAQVIDMAMAIHLKTQAQAKVNGTAEEIEALRRQIFDFEKATLHGEDSLHAPGGGAEFPAKLAYDPDREPASHGPLLPE